MQALLEAKADVNIASATGITPLISASANSDFKVISALVEAKADVNAAEKDGFSALHIAASKAHEASVKVLLEAKANCDVPASGCYPLHIAMDIDDAKKRLKVVTALLEDGQASLNVADSDGQTPLMHALRAEAMAKNTPLTKLLIEKKADVNELSEDLRPLHVAARVGSEVAIKALLKAKADVNMTLPAQGFTALHVAALSGNLQATKLLVEAKADLDVKDVAGMTPVFHAAMTGQDNLTTFLADSGADITPLQDEATMELMRMELHKLSMQQDEDEDEGFDADFAEAEDNKLNTIAEDGGDDADDDDDEEIEEKGSQE